MTRDERAATRDRRRQRVGTLAEHAGLLLWDETTRAGLCQILAAFRETPDPVAVLERLLADSARTALPPAATGPCCLPSSGASDVSKGGGGVCSPETWGTQ
jgi:hypothetical protein